MSTEFVISQEFFNPANFTKNLPKFVSNLRTVFERRDDLTTDLGKVPSYRLVRSKVEKTSYASLRETKVYVPAGLTVNYLTYMKVLDPAIEINELLLKDILNPFSRWLAEALTDPEKLKRVSAASSVRDFAPHDVDGSLEALGECFEKGSNANHIPFKQVFARNTDVKEAFEKAENQTSRFIAIDRKVILRKVDEISDNLEVLIQRIEEEDPDYQIAPRVMDLLSQMSYTLAQEVEFYGSMAFQLTQLTTSLNDTAKILR